MRRCPRISPIAVDGRDTGKKGDLAAGQDAKLRQTGYERYGDDRADAFDRGEDLVAALQAGVFRRERRDGGLEALDQAGLSVKLGLQQPFESRARGGGAVLPIASVFASCPNASASFLDR